VRPRLRHVTAILIAAAVVIPAPAAADNAWTKLSSDTSSAITIPEVAILGGSTAVVTWEQETSPSTADIVSDTFQTSPANDVANGVAGKAATDWASLDRTQALVPTPSGGLEIAFGGIHSTTSSDPLIGLIGANHNPDGSWSPPSLIGVGLGASVWSGVLTGSTTIMAGDAAGGIHVWVNPSGGASMEAAELQPQLGGCCGYEPKLAVDTSGRVWVAWYSNATGHVGIYVQQLDATTGQPIGAPALAPSSDSGNNTIYAKALSCAATCRLVYGDAPAGSATNVLVSWWIGEAAPTTIYDLGTSRPGAGTVVADAYRADGRMWVAWYNGNSQSYNYVLGDARGAAGTVQDAGAPSKEDGAHGLTAAAVGDNLLLAANFSANPLSNMSAFWVNDVAPPAPVSVAPGPRQTDLQTGPGGKGFRIQVQYRVPSFCKPTCTAHAEIRTRSGRQLYALAGTAPLPGDGKVVLGRRGSVKLPGGKKVRFYLTIDKRQLVRAPFSTVGGNRIARTRLRVWLQAKSSQVLTVRDGRIAVSIARIKSGALPGLSGIL
jgi:hypothetical protein